jgi:hypothetical protein
MDVRLRSCQLSPRGSPNAGPRFVLFIYLYLIFLYVMYIFFAFCPTSEGQTRALLLDGMMDIFCQTPVNMPSPLKRDLVSVKRDLVPDTCKHALSAMLAHSSATKSALTLLLLTTVLKRGALPFGRPKNRVFEHRDNSC